MAKPVFCTAAAAVKQVAGGLARQVDKGKLEAAEHDRILANITTATDLAELHDCDIVIESVVGDENLDASVSMVLEI